MSHLLKNRPVSTQVLRGVLPALLLAMSFGMEPVGARADAVDDLRQALPLRLEELGNPTPAILDYRRTTLQKKVDQLRTISELRRALALEEWKENPQVIS